MTSYFILPQVEPERIFKANNYSGPHSCYLLWASSYQQV